MRIVLQKVLKASVSVGSVVTGSIEHGYLLLVGIGKGSSEASADVLVEKILKLRLFSDSGSENFMEKNIVDAHGALLIVSQFTLFGDTSKGTRPSFSSAASSDDAQKLYRYIIEKFKDQGIVVQTGEFGEHMHVKLVNDGPITLILDTSPSS